jgi:prepilin-type processing-associated H-X9-DG protein
LRERRRRSRTAGSTNVLALDGHATLLRLGHACNRMCKVETFGGRQDREDDLLSIALSWITLSQIVTTLNSVLVPSTRQIDSKIADIDVRSIDRLGILRTGGSARTSGVGR